MRKQPAPVKVCCKDCRNERPVLHEFPAFDGSAVFVKPTTGGTAGIVAIGTGGDEKEYNVSWLTTTGGTHLDTGCWYCFPGPSTKVGTTLAVTHGAWTAGTIAN